MTRNQSRFRDSLPIRFKTEAREIVAYAAWKVFLWAIQMTAEEYWMECYKQERNRMCRDVE
jgi:hypothetical protein